MANTLRFKRGLVSGIPTAALGEPLFTTDTFDLYIGNGTGNTRFQKYIASGATTQILRGDGSLYTFPLAISSPTTGQVLKYNGTSWVNDSDAGITGSGAAGQVAYFTGATTQSGSNNLFWDSANNRLGIRTNAPNVPLHIVDTNPLVVGDSTGSLCVTYETGSIASGQGGGIFLGIPASGGSFFSTYIKAARETSDGANSSASLIFGTRVNGGANTQRARITSGGNFIINNASVDNGLRFQVTGDGYFSGSVGVGSSALTSIGLRVAKTITGGTLAYAVLQDGQVQSDVTNQAHGFYNTLSTQATSFTLSNYYHYRAFQGTIGAGSAVTNQYGFFVQSNLTGATNNYGFYGDIASGTNRWNLYMNGTAANYLNGSLGLGVTAPNNRLSVSVPFAATNDTGVILSAQTGVTSVASISTLVENVSTGATAMLFSTLTANGSLTEKMRLTNGGNLGLGVVPSAWGSSLSAIDIGQNSRISGSLSMAIGNNAFFNGTSWIYKNTGTSALNVMPNAGGHQWFTAPSGTAGNAITFTQAMTLDASGNLGVGVTTVGDKLEVAGNVYANAFNSIGTLSRYNTTGGIAMVGLAGTGYAFISAYSNASGTGKNLSLQKDGGNVLIGTTTDAGYKLDVNGTMRVSGASTFLDGITTNGNVFQPLIIRRAINSAGFSVEVPFQLLNSSSAYATYAHIRSYIVSNTAGAESGGLRFATSNGGSASTALEITNTGAATFSSSVTAGGILTVNSRAIINGGTTSEYSLNVNSNSSFAFGSTNGRRVAYFAYNTGDAPGIQLGYDATDNTGIIAGSTSALGAGIDFYTYNGSTWGSRLRIASTGAATFSSSIQAGTAIAIGTTPDTNKPFKVLKNINGTVGINFENTSTGSLAFSAIQMGTDVSGGTKFTNIVYSSSGVAQSGVYYPDGTSIINIGTGGLNFYSQGAPIRMFNGGGNGVLKWEMVNDSFINHYTGTAPTTSATDGYRQYSADVVAGNAAPHFRTENGAVIKLYQETTGVGNAIFSQGGGNSVLDDSTFDGYTLRQIVKALRNQGILA